MQAKDKCTPFATRGKALSPSGRKGVVATSHAFLFTEQVCYVTTIRCLQHIVSLLYSIRSCKQKTSVHRSPPEEGLLPQLVEKVLKPEVALLPNLLNKYAMILG